MAEVGRMSVVIPDEVLRSSGMTGPELLQEVAILLFQRERLTLAQASRLAGIGRLQFQHLLASRRIPVHYDVADFEQDLETLRDLGRA
jgi:predicted HTH domain antitoxin